MFDALSFLITIFLLIFVGTYKNKNVQAEAGYLLAYRTCSLWPLTCTLVMTALNTSSLFAFSGIGYVAGARALMLPLVVLIGLLFYSFSVAKKWKELNASSVAELFRLRYGKSLSQVASPLLISSMFGFTATYVKSVTLIFTPIFPYVNPWILSATLVLITLAMTLRGGLVSIVKTDIVSFCLVSIILPLIFYFSWKNRKTASFKRGYFLTALFAICSLILSNCLIDKILDKLILANIPVAALSFSLLAGFY